MGYHYKVWLAGRHGGPGDGTPTLTQTRRIRVVIATLSVPADSELPLSRARGTRARWRCKRHLAEPSVTGRWHRPGTTAAALA